MILCVYNLDSAKDADPVCQLNEGEYNAGRGPLLKCNDKRISRNHILIKVKNDEVSLTSTHPNPCFFQSANSKMVTILPKNSATVITDGDKFGFLPDQYWFRTQIVKELENFGKYEEKHDSDSSSHLADTEPVDYNGCTQNNDLKNEHVDYSELNVQETVNEAANNEDSNESLNFLSFQQSENDDESPEIGSSNVHTDNSVEASTSNKKRSIDNDTKESCKIMKTASQDENKLDSSNIASVEIDSHNSAEALTNSQSIECNRDSENALCNAVQESPDTNVIDSRSVTSSNAIADTTPTQTNNSANDGSNPGVSSTTRIFRDRCLYGSNCFRKNTTHKQEFSHPGDSDYDTDPDDKRPLCIYGSSCYRKNKLHRQHFRHPKGNATRTTRNRGRNTNRPRNDTPPDDYDIDDPFIDDSEDDFDASSWSESDSEFFESQEVNEDTKGLLKEARRFVKK